MNRRFPRAARVRVRSDFDRIFKHGRRVALPVLALHWHADAHANGDEQVAASAADGPVSTAEAVSPRAEARLGLAVSRKVDARAVVRNRIKRQLRDSFRHHRAWLAPGDYVVVARPGAAALASEALRSAFLGLLRRAGALTDPALPPVSLPGTMPAAACTDRVQPPSR
ncbi:ribonuclease P protein component [Lysobacter korlensis]|uniref:Ribonuclease P protein component n=1 Tax=Lysobacter korlensis TaxID=553636 RepID=A0ABV6RHJ6_9GAMM